MVGQEKTFNSADLLQYLEAFLKEIQQKAMKSLDQSNYSWLKSKHLQADYVVEKDLEELKPIIQKLSPVSCTTIAVKLDLLTEHITSTTVILSLLKKLLEEEDSMILLAVNARRGKETKNKKVKVHPVLSPPGRQATVSFVFKVEN